VHLLFLDMMTAGTNDEPRVSDTMGAQNFVSALSIDPLLEAGCSPSRVHVIYGASKDWGANGFRIGCLISQGNPQLHTAMESSCLLMKISSPAVS
jgi:1-aminocyclopropane-1-carboxylate synthase